MAERKPRDGCVVATGALAPLLEEFVEQWEREHPDLVVKMRRQPPDGERVTTSDSGGVRILHERTLLAGQAVPLRTIRNILERRSPRTELRTADPLLLVLGRLEALYDGTLEVSPNPLAPPHVRALCCGGSA